MEQEQSTQNQPGEEKEKLASTKSAFSKNFLELSKAVRDVQGLDTAEMQLIANITATLIKYAGTESGRAILTQIKTIIDKKIGA